MGLSYAAFVDGLTYEAIPEDVRQVLRRSLCDTLGVAAIGSTTEIARITRDYATAFWQSGPNAPSSRILMHGRTASPAGAAFAGAFTVDSIDAHDGSSPCKGHAGSCIIPGLLALVDMMRCGGQTVTGRDLMLALALGYETAYRAGVTQHETVPDYHTSGTWAALGLATGGGRLLGLEPDQIRHAAGIAEYHAPRSQMMRCIAHPTMLRDGVGWGAPTGVSAIQMAQMGFTGAPAITAEGDGIEAWWGDLGERWDIVTMTHYKRYPVCRWAHPAMDALKDLMTEHRLSHRDIDRIQVVTFHNAVELAGPEPQSMDELAYSICFPVAMMAVRGKVGLDELQPAIFSDPDILRLSRRTELQEDETYNRLAKTERWAHVALTLTDGRTLRSDPRRPKGDPDNPLSDEEFTRKFHLFADPVLGAERAGELEALALRFDDLPDEGFNHLLDLALEGQANKSRP
ncbi:MmgE/PrpD family protein [Coralliovum pocilloporae]|uniref:MmgE/PrpD family protein n=1 Tax=Coralliovum pocilloporae TaxID=3066369 RepID=UPI0033070F1F